MGHMDQVRVGAGVKNLTRLDVGCTINHGLKNRQSPSWLGQVDLDSALNEYGPMGLTHATRPSPMKLGHQTQPTIFILNWGSAKPHVTRPTWLELSLEQVGSRVRVFFLAINCRFHLWLDLFASPTCIPLYIQKEPNISNLDKFYWNLNVLFDLNLNIEFEFKQV